MILLHILSNSLEIPLCSVDDAGNPSPSVGNVLLSTCDGTCVAPRTPPRVRLESLHELGCRSFFVRFRAAGLSPLVLGSALTSNGCSPRSSGESPCVPGFQLGMCQLHLPTKLPLNSRNHCVWKSGLQAPGPSLQT